MVGSVGLGCIFGSFLNALSFRFNTGRGMGGRSRCMHCGHTLAAVDLVPVLSYVFLRGRCRYCEGHVSPQYPLVELLAGLLSLGIFLQFSSVMGFFDGAAFLYQPFLWFQCAYFLLIWLTILFIVVYDLRHQIIPWSASLLLAALTFGALFLSSLQNLPSFSVVVPSLWPLLAGPLLASPLFLISLVSGGRWMGWGDSIFELSLGWLLGLTAGLTALMLSFWIGAAVGIALMLSAQRPLSFVVGRFTMNSEIPFAPFLALGAVLAYFFHVNLFSTLPSLF